MIPLWMSIAVRRAFERSDQPLRLVRGDLARGQHVQNLFAVLVHGFLLTRS